jgi:AcrR family transcriptional regulator
VRVDASSRRELSVRQRTDNILSVALRLVLSEGFSSFSMERLAEATGYSRAALYKYFPCKEEVAMALAIESTKRRIELDHLVAGFVAKPRERFAALNEACVILHPELLNLELLAYTRAFRDRTSPERQKELNDLEVLLYQIGIDIVQSAIDGGDLELPSSVSPRELVFSLWILVVGMLGETTAADPIEQLGIGDRVALLRRTGSMLMDAYGWKPLTSEWDYRQTMRRIYAELFTPVVIDRIKRF